MKQVPQSAVQLPSAPTGTDWVVALRGALVLVLLSGGLYPLVAVSIGAALFPHQSTGSLIERDGRVIGSTLVGQPFRAPGYFQGRPSAAGYDPFSMSGSNWAPGNPDLRKRAATTSKAIAKDDGVAANTIPVDLVAASGSGIDPDISPEAAAIQVERVAAARALSRTRVMTLVRDHTQGPTFGILGQPRINVLQLNLALDALRPSATQ